MLEESATVWRDCLSRWALGTLRKTRGGGGKLEFTSPGLLAAGFGLCRHS